MFYGSFKIRPSIEPTGTDSPTVEQYEQYVDQAEAARDLARLWANEAEDSVVADGDYSSLHHAAKAAASAGTAVAVLSDAGFVAVSGDLLGADTIGVVAGSIANVNIVAARDADIGILAPIAGNITTVAGSQASVVTVAGIADNVTTVAGIAPHVTTLAPLDTEIAALGPRAADIQTVAADGTNIGIVAGIASDVTTVADNMAVVQGAADELTDINIAMLQMATAFTNSQTRFLAAYP